MPLINRILKRMRNHEPVRSDTAWRYVTNYDCEWVAMSDGSSLKAIYYACRWKDGVLEKRRLTSEEWREVEDIEDWQNPMES